jgi:hypothetical protein
MIRNGDHEMHQDLCHEMLAALRESPGEEILAQTASLCVSAALDLNAEDKAALTNLINQLASSDAYRPMARYFEGAFKYRSGEIASAIQTLRRVEEEDLPREPYSAHEAAAKVRARLFLAMAYEKTGEHEMAIKSLANANRLLDDFDYVDVEGFARLRCEVVRQEAESVVLKSGTAVNRATDEPAGTSS